MNRIDFLSRLKQLLSDIPDSEREEALQYYNDYLNDAGVENEEEVLEALGTPENLAVSIKEGLRDSEPGGGEFSEKGYFREPEGPGNPVAPWEGKAFEGSPAEEQPVDSGKQGGSEKEDEKSGSSTNDGGRNGSSYGSTDRTGGYGNGGGQAYRSSAQQGSDFNSRYRGGRKPKKGMSGGMIALIVILCALASPVLIPVVFVAALVLFILAMIFIPLILVFLFVGVICIFAGVVSFFWSFVDLFTFPAGAVLSVGMSLVTVGVGILMTLGIGWIISLIFPKAFRKVVDFFSGMVHRKGGRER